MSAVAAVEAAGAATNPRSVQTAKALEEALVASQAAQQARQEGLRADMEQQRMQQQKRTEALEEALEAQAATTQPLASLPRVGSVSLQAEQTGDDNAPLVPSGSEDSAATAAAAADSAGPRILSREDPGRYALITLSLINLLNYIDRYVPSATKQYIQDDLGLSDTETSVPLTAFVFVYMCCCPLFSWLADKGYARNKLIALGVMIWSVATAAGALSVNFATLLISRAMVGVGEAAYATIAPALLSDFYPPRQRNTVLSMFYMAIPIGAAMGYAIGGEIGGHFGWRVAFLVAGAPGLVVAGMCLAIKEPVVGARDIPVASAPSTAAPGGAVVPPSSSMRRRPSQTDIMFGLDDEGMVDVLGDQQGQQQEGDVGFAVHSELGGTPMVHPHRRGGYHPPPMQAPDASTSPETRSILVRSVVSDVDGDSSTTDALSPRSSSASPDGSSDEIVCTNKPPPWGESIRYLVKNSMYCYCTVGLTAVTFASGGLADWIATWMNRVHGVSKESSSTLVGALTCVGGIIGTAYGAWLGEWAKGKIKQPYLGVAGLNLMITTICAWAINMIPEGRGEHNSYVVAIAALVFVAQVCLWSYTGPINALTVNSVPANMRVRAFAFQIFFIHAFGDAISPTIVGAISDATGSIRNALLIIPAAFSVAMVTWLVGWRRMADEESYDGRTALIQQQKEKQSAEDAVAEPDALQRGGGGAAAERALHNPLLSSGDGGAPYGSSNDTSGLVRSGSRVGSVNRPHRNSSISGGGGGGSAGPASAASSAPSSAAHSYEASVGATAAFNLKRLSHQHDTNML